MPHGINARPCDPVMPAAAAARGSDLSAHLSAHNPPHTPPPPLA